MNKNIDHRDKGDNIIDRSINHIVYKYYNVYLKPYSLNINQILIINMYYIN